MFYVVPFHVTQIESTIYKPLIYIVIIKEKEKKREQQDGFITYGKMRHKAC